jgi:hypothetical protein
MSQTTSPGTGKPYGLERVCRVLEFPRSTIYAQQGQGERQGGSAAPGAARAEAKDCRC